MIRKTLTNLILSLAVAGCATVAPKVEPTYVPPMVDSCHVSNPRVENIDGNRVVYNQRHNAQDCDDKTFGFVYLMGDRTWKHIKFSSEGNKLLARVAGPFEGPVNHNTLLNETGSIYECVNDGAGFECEFRGKFTLIGYNKNAEVLPFSRMESVGINARASTFAHDANVGYELMGRMKPRSVSSK